MPEAQTELVMLPGLDGSSVLFAPLLSALPATIRPRVIPLPSAGPNDYASLTEFVRNELRGVARPVILAWSFAGPIGIRLAADPAIAARGLILAASFVSNPHPYLRFARPLAVPWLLAFFTYASRTKVLLGSHSSPRLQALLRQAHEHLTGRVIADRVLALLACDESGIASSLHLPILYVSSSQDLVVPGSNARRLAHSCPHARLRVIPGPHLALATNPAAAAAEISDFIAACLSA